MTRGALFDILFERLYVSSRSFVAFFFTSKLSRRETCSSSRRPLPYLPLPSPTRPTNSIKRDGRYRFQAHLVSIACTDISHLFTDENNDSTCRHMPGIPPSARCRQNRNGLAEGLWWLVSPPRCASTHVFFRLKATVSSDVAYIVAVNVFLIKRLR